VQTARCQGRVRTNAIGQAELSLKTQWHDGTTNLVLCPLKFTQRLAALVPRPRLRRTGLPDSGRS
jgi:hypothetical protein